MKPTPPLQEKEQTSRQHPRIKPLDPKNFPIPS